MTLSVTEVLDGLLGKFLRPLRTWIEREWVAPLRAAYDAAMQTKEQYRDGVYLHLRERLEGTDEHPLAEGVPVRPLPQVQDLAHLQEAVELLGERKIEGASPDIPDGVSLVRLLCDSSLASQVTELVDTNEGWTWDKDLPNFPNVERLTIGCKFLEYPTTLPLKTNLVSIVIDDLVSYYSNRNFIYNNSNLVELRFRSLAYMDNGFTYDSPLSDCFISTCPNLKKVTLDSLYHYGEDIKGRSISNGGAYCCLIHSCPNLEEVYLPSYVGYKNWRIVRNVPKLRKLVLGTISYGVPSLYSSTAYPFDSCGQLVHLEIGGAVVNLDFRSWSPTMALRTDTTASDYIDLREDKDDSGEFINATNLEQFLANFRKYIILRVANRSGIDPTTGRQYTALTLTLSAAVYQSIYGLDSSNNADNNSWARTHTLADLGLTEADLTEAEQAAGITVNTIYATWLDTYRSAINWNIGH